MHLGRQYIPILVLPGDLFSLLNFIGLSTIRNFIKNAHKYKYLIFEIVIDKFT